MEKPARLAPPHVNTVRAILSAVWAIAQQADCGCLEPGKYAD